MDTISTGIIEILRQGNTYTADQLGKIFSVSEKTIRNRVKEINTQIIEHGAVIISERGSGNKAGYHIDLIDTDAFLSWMKMLAEEKKEIPNSSEERVSYLIDFLLNQKDYVIIDDLCDLIYVSRNTLSSDLRKTEQVLRSYNLKIDRRPNYGIMTVGSEQDKRVCIIDYFSKNYQYSMDKIRKESTLMVIGDTLSSLFHKNDYMSSVENYQMIKSAIYVANDRRSLGFDLSYSEKQRKELKEKLPEKIIRLTERIVADLGAAFSALNDEDEKLFISMQIAGRGNIDVETVPQTGVNIDLLIQNMLKELQDGLKVDLRDDLNLILSLKHHMVAFDIRMQYGIRIDNPILYLIKKQYSFAYALASYSCNYLSEYYDEPIPEEEIGYIAIIYALALEKKLSPERKKNVVIVCAAGNSSSRFFMHKYKETFSDHLNVIYECSAADISDFDFQGKKIDYCFTTLDMELDIPVPCYKISIFPSEAEIRQHKQLLSNIRREEILKYYDRRLFMPHLECCDKKDAIAQMIAKIRDYYEIPDDFEELVMQRERYGMTSFGNLAATPHPTKVCTKENIVCTAILDKAIDWGQNDVRFIILLSFSYDEDQDTSLFIEATSDLIASEAAVNEVIESRSFDRMIDLLCLRQNR